jgi:exonuclease SbcC
VITNKPTGDAYRSNWGGDTVVEITLKNGTVVKRTKGNSTNEYELQLKGVEALVFKAFGTEVPIEIKNALIFDSINIQEQLDAPYLFSETPGDVAKHFNKIAKLEKIDLSIQRVQSAINKLTQEINTSNSNIKVFKEALKDFDFIQEFENRLQILESKVSRQNEMHLQRKVLVELFKTLEQVEEAKLNWTEAIKNEELVDTLLSYITKNKSNRQALKQVKSIINSLNFTAEQQKDLQSIIDSEIIINKLLSLHKELKEVRKALTNFVNLTNSINSLRSKQESMLKTLEKWEEDYHRDFPDTCPLCGTQIKK